MDLRLALITVVLGAAITAAPTQVAWTELQPPSRPSLRDAVRMAWDHARGEVLLFGGDGHAPRNDTWSWNGATWAQLTPASSPPGHAWHALASDSSRQRVVLFGGIDSNGVIDQTWEWDGSNWSTPGAIPSPPARTFPAMAYDALRGEIVLFGGFPAQSPLADTWTWDGLSWTSRSTGTTPPARGWHAMAFDEHRGEVVMFGGYAGGASATFADTWVWNGTDWSPRAPATPPPGQLGHGLVFDYVRSRVVMTPGFERPAVSQRTWEWDGADWQQTGNGSGPIGNWDHGVAFDRSNARTIVFGGRGPGGGSDKTWEYVSVNAAALTTLGVGCPGSAGTPVMSPQRWPWLGDTMRVRVAPVPSQGLVLFVLGFSDTLWGARALPTSLAPEGMPGCIGYVSAEIAFAVTASGGAAQWNSTLPANPTFVGLQYFAQAVVFDALVATPFPGVVTNALRITVGQR